MGVGVGGRIVQVSERRGLTAEAAEGAEGEEEEKKRIQHKGTKTQN